MQQDPSKISLSAEDQQSIQAIKNEVENELLKFTNVVGVGIGVKYENGQATGTPSIVALVDQKLPEDQIADGEIVPKDIKGVKTDVIAVGYLIAGENQTINGDVQTLKKRVRPAKGGYSVGHKNITAGTIGTCVYDMLPGGSANPPVHGTGIPSRYYILSNNHVLANSNSASIGDPILQPGPADGGTDPADRIARLSRFVPITFAPQVPLERHNNIVDAAIAEGEFHDLDREVYWTGNIRGWRRKANVTVGTNVTKTGRTTSKSFGTIRAINATVDVNYDGGKVARFKNQILTTPMSAGGDSGSLITTVDNVAVGLLYAGSAAATIACHIEDVRSLLKVEVADQIL
ncbi:hypothetical protein [Bacillus thuringiensis]|uniref:hypothetical protein n=1 Tax=Bacillus thuringiensis TaxID=1428 RepID=UPI000BF3D226|nr:hypothetical protein [Bacillus thuringiensis]MED3526405.1 hypothetical protein [Bacillus thuringiensis]PFE93584.1 hypothetical protein CN325_21625 [Bacillus thuringiensis]PGP18770.1 hypothetical protein CN987_30060 [Bacillus thuringiensis]